MTPVEVIRRLAATPSRIEKEQVLLDAWMHGCFEFFDGVKLAADTLLPFHVTKVATIDDPGDAVSDFGWREFAALAMKLHHRQLSGDAAREAINTAALAAPHEMWNEFYRPILLKDLAVSDRTINKVLDKLVSAYPQAARYRVPTFGCQLPQDAAKHKLCGSKMLDVFLHGTRLLTVLDKESNKVTQWTANGKQTDAFPHLATGLASLLARIPTSVVLDGVVTTTTFQDLMAHRAAHDAKTSRLALFDILPLRAFKAGRYDMPQRDRHQALCGLIPVLQALSPESGSFRLAYVLPKLTVDLDTPAGQADCERFTAEATAAGCDSIMIKDPDAPYLGKRTVGWLRKGVTL